MRLEVALLVSACLSALADQAPQFEVASVKLAPRPASRLAALPREQGGPGTSDPARISYRNISMSMPIRQAYEVNTADVVGPAWATTLSLMADEGRYDIDATLPADTSKEQYRLMWQNLLAERFALRVHREKKEAAAYALVPARNGPKLKASPAIPPGSETGERVNVSIRGEDGFPVTPPGYSGLFVNVKSGHIRVKFIRYSMDQFAKWTRVQTKRPGIDRTSLTGVFDFYLEFGSDTGALRTGSGDTTEAPDRGEDFAVALQNSLDSSWCRTGRKSNCW